MSQNMNLSMTPYTQAGAFVCSQYDVGRECQITLVDDSGNYTIPTGATITVMATKPSGLGFTVACTWTGSTVTFSTTDTMTNEFGRFPAELRITQGNTILGTTNFYFKVEKSPHPNDVIDDDVIIHQNLVARVTTLEGQMATVQSDITDVKADIGDLSELETEDKSSLVNAINEAMGTGGGAGVPSNVRQAMLTLFESAAYSTTGLTDEIAIVESWAETITGITLNNSTISISGASTSQLVATTVPSGGTVTWSSSDTSVATVSSSGLVTGVGNGTATITASCGGLSAQCTATVSGFVTLVSISAVYTQGGTVYDTDTLDSLKTDLVVTAHYDNSTTATVASTDYTLSGTLAEGTSTITVSYGGKTTTFNVTVTEAPTYVTNGLFAFWDAIDNQATGNHDSSALTWVDKINSYTWTPVVSDGTQKWSWDDDGLIFAPTSTGNTANSGNAFECPRPTTGLRTLEVVLTPEAVTACAGEFTSDLTGVTDSTTQIIAVSANDNTFIIRGSQNSYNAGNLTNIKSIVATYGSSYAPVKAYMNGSEVTSRGSSHSFKYHVHSDMVLGTQNAQTYTYPFKGVIHAIRFYDRELTAEEIAQNYAIDVARFGLE